MLRDNVLPILGVVLLFGAVCTQWGAVATDAEHERPEVSKESPLIRSGPNTVDESSVFPWITDQGELGEEQIDPSHRASFDALVAEYQRGGLTPDSKPRIRRALQTAKQDPVLRAWILDAFLGSQGPLMAQGIYGLMRDADLKDPALLEALIQRDLSGGDVAVSKRILDLIADAMSSDNAAYSATVDVYLSQLMESKDEGLRQMAVSQKIWWVARQRPDQLASLAPLVLDRSAVVREEMYGLMESDLHASSSSQARTAYLSVLAELARSSEIVMPEAERQRVASLHTALNRP